MIVLAPMAGVADLPFRLLCKEFGCDFVTSEMISAKGIIYKNKRTDELLRTTNDETPMAIQLFGNIPAVMADAAQWVAEHIKPSAIDLNMGCPTPKVVKNGYGSYLLKEPLLASEIAMAVVNSVKTPVTAKIRLGWDGYSINCVEIARRLEDVGIQGITIHGRTSKQLYSGNADWNWIARVKEKINIPVTGNGDILIPEDAKAMIEQTKCDHIMIGRAALGDPWIFPRVKVYLKSGTLLSEPTSYEKIKMAIKHLKMKVALVGEERAVREMRPHINWYLKGIPNSNKLKYEINQSTILDEVVELLRQLL